MNTAVGMLTSGTFLVLALWHVRMAFRPMSGESAAVPSMNGKPLFVPSRASTLLVALALCLFAGLVAATSGLMHLGISPRVLSWLCYVLALGLFARAIGEFRYVGFFKRVRDTRFARMDTFLYSPLCVLLAAGVAVVAFAHAT
jgi:hypothetical protein